MEAGCPGGVVIVRAAHGAAAAASRRESLCPKDDKTKDSVPAKHPEAAGRTACTGNQCPAIACALAAILHGICFRLAQGEFL